MTHDADYTRRAFAAYFRSGDNPAQPSNGSGCVTVAGKVYVHLFNVNGTLAVYRVENVGRLKRLKRWPAEIGVNPARNGIKWTVRDLRHKTNEIEALLANELGLGDLESLSALEREKLSDEAEEAIDNWLLAEHEDWQLEPKTPLQRLFREYSEIEEEILDNRDARSRLLR